MKLITQTTRAALIVGTLLAAMGSHSHGKSNGSTTEPPSATIRDITCPDLQLTMTLNSHHINAKSESGDSLRIEVDKTQWQNKTVYLQYLEKGCMENPDANPQSCTFKFAVYTAKPNFKVPNSKGFLHFNFPAQKIEQLEVVNGTVPENEIAIPESCLSLANELVARENELNEIWKDRSRQN